MEKQGQYEVEVAEIDEVRVEEIDLDNLAWLMLNWGKVRRQLTEIEEAIKDTVLTLGKTQTVGTVRATYSKPRKSYDYEGPVLDILGGNGDSAVAKVAVADNTRSVVDWRAVCGALELKPDVTEGSGPGSVSVKLLK